MTKDDKIKQAIEALENAAREWSCYVEVDHAPRSLSAQLAPEIAIILEALAQPAQEPVAWMHVMDNTEGIKANGKGIVSITQKRKHPFGKPGVDFSKSFPVTSTPLYTTPPAAPKEKNT